MSLPANRLTFLSSCNQCHPERMISPILAPPSFRRINKNTLRAHLQSLMGIMTIPLNRDIEGKVKTSFLPVILILSGAAGALLISYRLHDFYPGRIGFLAPDKNKVTPYFSMLPRLPRLILTLWGKILIEDSGSARYRENASLKSAR